MSSNSLENGLTIPGPRRHRFLLKLKTGGPQNSASLGASFGITDEAARQQLMKLAREGLVDSASEISGVGRPSQVWHLTAAGHALFPDGHAELTLQLIENVRSELGEEALDRLIAARERETRKQYFAELSSLPELRGKVEALAAIRSREGYMAEWREEGDGFLLLENHCPICAAASVCQGFCRAELQVFQESLGPYATVVRVEHILSGARRCAYLIRPASGPAG